VNPAGQDLRIPDDEVARRIETYIRDRVERHSAEGILIGLSGGLDSAVLTALAVRALGGDRVHVAFLYDRDTDAASERKARLVADSLGLDLPSESIEPAMQERGVYAPFAMRGSALSRLLNRFSLNLYRLLFREAAFESSLRRGHFGRNRLKRVVYTRTVGHIEAAFNARHIYRREMLEARAQAHNWLLLGAANRSECMVGWFVKDGVDDLPISPIMGLYKTQVRQLAAYLDIPPEIREQTPSPDMMKGVTDEFAVGVLYERIDLILDGMERGLPDEEIAALGVPRDEIGRVRRIHRLSAWKRESPHETPPVDGGISGGLRVD